MKVRPTGLAVATLLAHGAGAQSPAQQPAATTPVGIWRGTSVCLVRPSACKDEIVVFRIAHTKAADSLTLDGRKIVRGEIAQVSGPFGDPAAPAPWSGRNAQTGVVREGMTRRHPEPPSAFQAHETHE
jgi:hypothetical protein